MTDKEMVLIAKNCKNGHGNCAACPLEATEDCTLWLACQLADRVEQMSEQLETKCVDIVDKMMEKGRGK